MLTIREALDLPVFSGARVVAGHEGLSNEIRWVHTSDLPDARFEWNRTGVLLLTSGFGLENDASRQTRLISKLSEQGFAGIVFSTEHYLDHVPEKIRHTADELGFPVIEVPPELLFIDITQAILGRIVNRQYDLLTRSNEIHARLTDLVLSGGGLNELAKTLSGILDRSITIEDASFQVLATAQRGSVDEARKRSVSSGRTTPELAKRLISKGVYDRMLKNMAPVHVSPIPDLGMTLDRIVAPIIVDRNIHGYIWLISGDHPLTDLDELTIAQGATVAALILFKDQSVRAAEEALRGDFFDWLLMGETDKALFGESAQRLRYRPQQPHQILVVKAISETGERNPSLHLDLESWSIQAGIQGFWVQRDEDMVLVLESQEREEGLRVGREIVEAHSQPPQRLLIGVGDLFPAESGVEQIRYSYEGAREAARIARAMGRPEGVFPFHELGLLHWLYHLPEESRAGNIYLEFIRTLAEHDAATEKELLKTLEAYLDCGGSLVEAAQALYVHRNTLVNRIERIQDMCPVDLRDPVDRLNLHVAIKGYRLFE
jgi:purine catabolism regulator